jgi:hypothetical protein
MTPEATAPTPSVVPGRATGEPQRLGDEFAGQHSDEACAFGTAGQPVDDAKSDQGRPVRLRDGGDQRGRCGCDPSWGGRTSPAR